MSRSGVSRKPAAPNSNASQSSALSRSNRSGKRWVRRVIASLDKHVKDGRFKGWIDCVAMCFPAAIQQIDLDASVNWLAGVDANRSVAKIGAGFTVPNTELNDLDFIAIRADELFAEIARKPTRLEFELRRNSRRHEQRALVNPPSFTDFCVAFCQRAHATIMRSARLDVTQDPGSARVSQFWGAQAASLCSPALENTRDTCATPWRLDCRSLFLFCQHWFA